MSDLQQLESPVTQRPTGGETGFDTLLRVAAAAPRKHRQLPERILVAAHQACDIGALAAADRLLSVLDAMLAEDGGAAPAVHRRVVEGMVAAYERLWHLRRRIGS